MLNLSIDPVNIEASFDQIADQLFNQYLLSIGKKRYQFTEIEFYYNTIAATKDNFAHQHGEEYLDGTWRLHSSGLDIVLKGIGSYYGGILIRGIQELDEQFQPIGTPIDGPWNTVTTCVREMGAVDKTKSFVLTKRLEDKKRKFIKSPRVGLFLKEAENLEYICKPWRYTSIPVVTKKYRHLVYLQLCLDKNKMTETEHTSILEQLGLSQRSMEDYKRYFEAGKHTDLDTLVGGKTTVENTCKLFGHYTIKL
ncbi:hypothetical protein [Aureispira anguillae]|uniref:Uncharacterized protein n=1 Tax=Aureispira anguillae TaxID=2864201 RepID=A0A915YK22_9BACT|nr:hypothetical protein [Aureispira anguillae]BDS14505.1 hypothetical protein AsAng_0052850 [Aureispira anguillae]